MTFQIAMVGKDGLVVASDRAVAMLAWSEREGKTQRQLQESCKFTESKHGNVLCASAGGNAAVEVARAIASKCNPIDYPAESDWVESLAAIVGPFREENKGSPDQVIVVRTDMPTRFWLVNLQL
jgi:hypothetical protein